MEDAIVAKDVMEVEVRRRTSLALAKANLLGSVIIEDKKARLLLDEALIMHQVSPHFHCSK